MQNKTNNERLKAFKETMTDRYFLRNIRLSKKGMLDLLSEEDWKAYLNQLLDSEVLSCKDVLALTINTLNRVSPLPKEGWLEYLYSYTIGQLFPERDKKENKKKHEDLSTGRLLLFQILGGVFNQHREENAFDPQRDFEFLNPEEYSEYDCASEYKRLMEIKEDLYLLEFMKIGTEITPYDTLGHIGGVHHVCMFIAKQLRNFGLPIDLALVSGAAFTHDIGKYGGTVEESNRIPYLHYYYTDQFLTQNGMPTIGHIASNHSTWDLELENLSVESLVLIYADFRVKSVRNEEGKELVHFLNLKDSFDVILGKLDNVDQTKKDRYIKVYSKLKDFEEYMEALGVNPDLSNGTKENPPVKDASLMDTLEVLDTFKRLAIEHNIVLMSKFNNETSFGNLLEAARSEKNWKNIRAYVNIFEEYHTYMTQKQKDMTLDYLYELLMHREGDIRRQAGNLMGQIIADYDEEYRKEVPSGAIQKNGEMTALIVWDRYLRMIVFPEYKVTEQHRRWIGYALRSLIISILRNIPNDERLAFIAKILDLCQKDDLSDHEVFVVLDALLFIPLKEISQKDRKAVIDFAAKVSQRNSLEIKICSLRLTKYMVETDKGPGIIKRAEEIVGNNKETTSISGTYLKYKIFSLIGGREEEAGKCEKVFGKHSQGISNVFLENLKVDTPWVVKAVNIELLLERLNKGEEGELLHITTHLSNLLKVSEKVTVRHSAGKALLSVINHLPLDERNEVVIELMRGLEIGEYQFSKYIPEYLGEMSLYLHPNELDEFIKEVTKQTESTNDRISSVALDTVGIMVTKYPQYRERFEEEEKVNRARQERLLGILLKGLANYREVVSQEAFEVIGQYIFANEDLTLVEKATIFQVVNKKMLTLLMDQPEVGLAFYNNAASLNNIYRFIKNHHFYHELANPEPRRKVAFFPGTFDPFSLSHKAIVREIRDLGFEVYLALDEFSWSKKTQPRMVRRKIITMSVADERHVYIFPDSLPVNISNDGDLERLKEMLPHQDLYIVVGSDVLVYASSYRKEVTENSIHKFNHIVFKRESIVLGKCEEKKLQEAMEGIQGDIVQLKLPTYLEDISSTQIRENIDYNRDISNLIDNVAQNYIYDNSLYLREPQYKLIMQTKGITIEEAKGGNKELVEEIDGDLFGKNPKLGRLKEYLMEEKTNIVIVRDAPPASKIVGVGGYQNKEKGDLFGEFKDLDTTAHLREKATGKIAVISCLYFLEQTEIRDLPQLLLTEVLAACLREDYGYAVYHRRQSGPLNRKVLEVLLRQGFVKAPAKEGMNIYMVDMKAPISLLQNIETTIKDPLNRNPRVLSVMDRAHKNLQRSLTFLYPGNLVISFNAGVLHHKLVKMITVENKVSSETSQDKILGPYMCVPFGKILRVMAVPNTVTKTLHTDKIFTPDIKGFRIGEYPYYSPLINQVRTIKSFDKDVILVDDLLHKGYRIRELDPIFKGEKVNIRKIIVGILSGRGKDLMTIQKRKVDSAYFIANLKAWFVESSLYPFVGGDSVARKPISNVSILPSINLVQPYVAPGYLPGASKEAVYRFSKTCLENSRDILMVLEEEYQVLYGKNLTLKRLGEVVISSRSPDHGDCLSYDLNLAPSVYIANDIEKLKRLKDSLAE